MRNARILLPQYVHMMNEERKQNENTPGHSTLKHTSNSFSNSLMNTTTNVV
jgi:hypothetical protein